MAGIGVEEGFFDEMIFKLNLMEGQSCLVGPGEKGVLNGGLKCLRTWKKGNASLRLRWGEWVEGRKTEGAGTPLGGFKDHSWRRWRRAVGRCELGSSGKMEGRKERSGGSRRGEVKALLSVRGVSEVVLNRRKLFKFLSVESGGWGWNVPEGESSQGEGSGSGVGRSMGKKTRKE